MDHPTDSGSPSPSASNSVTTRAEPVAGNNTAQPPLTSGFGAVIDKEYDLQMATEGSLGHVSGDHSRDIDRILRHQHSRLGANIALLEQRYAALPHPERFASWNERHLATDTTLHVGNGDDSQLLRNLIAGHAGLQTDVEALIECAADGQRGELILGEVSRNHEEMAWMLTALLKEDATSTAVADHGRDGALDSRIRAEQSWVNEGGPEGRVDRPVGLHGVPVDQTST